MLPAYEISRTSFKIYLITYILFGQFPDKIKEANAFPGRIFQTTKQDSFGAILKNNTFLFLHNSGGWAVVFQIK